MTQDFFSYIEMVPIAGCWLWVGPTCSNGRYGRSVGGQEFMAHRESYAIAHGVIPKGKLVCHRCDNGLCVNPHHMFLGTQSENMADAAKKGRIPMLQNQRHENNSSAKITMLIADQIRAARNTGLSYAKIARKFGLKSHGHAHAIVCGKLWVE